MLLPPKTTLSLINLLILWLHLCVAPAPSAAMLPLCQLLSLPSLQKSIKLRKPMEGVWGTTIYRFQKDLRNEIRGFASLNDNSPTRLWNNNQNKSFSLCFFFFFPNFKGSRESWCLHISLEPLQEVWGRLYGLGFYYLVHLLLFFFPFFFCSVPFYLKAPHHPLTIWLFSGLEIETLQAWAQLSGGGFWSVIINLKPYSKLFSTFSYEE